MAREIAVAMHRESHATARPPMSKALELDDPSTGTRLYVQLLDNGTCLVQQVTTGGAQMEVRMSLSPLAQLQLAAAVDAARVLAAGAS
jgi:hypothetical protein